MKSLEEWEDVFGIKVMDADGFPSVSRTETYMSHDEFIEGCLGSTIMEKTDNTKLKKAFDEYRENMIRNK